MNYFPMILPHGYQELFTLEGLASIACVHPALIEHYVEYGLLEPSQFINGVRFFDANCIPRIKTIQRLRMEVGVSLPGISIILDLTDKVRRLQYENEWLRQERP